MACREYTLPRDDETSQPRGWIQRHTKNGPVLEVTTSYLHGKHGDQIRTVSLNRGNTDSWVRISQRSNKFVMDLNNNDTAIPEYQLDDRALQLDAHHFVKPNKGKSKPQRRDSADSSTRIVHMDKKNLIDTESSKYFLCTKFERK